MSQAGLCDQATPHYRLVLLHLPSVSMQQSNRVESHELIRMSVGHCC